MLCIIKRMRVCKKINYLKRNTNRRKFIPFPVANLSFKLNILCAFIVSKLNIPVVSTLLELL